MTLRVAHVITKLDVGGAQTHVVELARAQVAAGYDVAVVAGVGGPAAERLVADGVPVRVVAELGASHGRLSQRAALAGVAGALGELEPDLVHGHSSNGGLAARLAARRLQLPSVYTAHGWPFQAGAAWRQRVMSLAGELVGGHVGDAVIVLTQAEYDRARHARIVPADRLWIVPNGIADVPPEGRRGPLAGRRPTLVMVARFAPPKLQAELIDVLAQLADLPWVLRLVGDGPEQGSVRSAAAAHPQLAARVEFLGHRDDVAALLAASDIGILWSRYEGLPISVMEYMRAGLCCVASDLPGTRALFGRAPAGLVAASSGELGDVLRGLLTEPERIDALGALARHRYTEAYSIEALVRATSDVYAAVLAGLRRSAHRRQRTLRSFR